MATLKTLIDIMTGSVGQHIPASHTCRSSLVCDLFVALKQLLYSLIVLVHRYQFVKKPRPSPIEP